MSGTSDGVISVEALQLALRTLDECCHAQLHLISADVIQLFLETSSRLENEISGDDPVHSPHLQEDLRRIAEIFRSLGKNGDGG